MAHYGPNGGGRSDGDGWGPPREDRRGPPGHPNDHHDPKRQRLHAGHSGGHRGGHGGGRGGRGRGGPRRVVESDIKVKTNVFALKTKKDNDEGAWVEYHVDIMPARRLKEQEIAFVRDSDEDIPFIKGLDMKVLPESAQDVYLVAFRRKDKENPEDIQEPKCLDLGRGSTRRSRHILQKLQERAWGQNKLCFMMDGDSMAYSPEEYRVFSQADPVTKVMGMGEVSAGQKHVNGHGTYGPADVGATTSSEPLPTTTQEVTGLKSRIFQVCVKLSCDEEDEGERIKNAFFLVKLTQTRNIEYQIVQGRLEPRVKELQQAMDVSKCLNTLLKSRLLTKLVGFGRSPRTFHFKEEMYDGVEDLARLLSRKMTNGFFTGNNEHDRHVPMMGLREMLEVCSTGHAVVKKSVGVSFCHRGKEWRAGQTHQQREYFPVVTSVRNKPRRLDIAGVEVDSNALIRDPTTQDRILESLTNMTLRVKYQIQKYPQKWAQDITEEQKRKKCRKVFRVRLSDPQLQRRPARVDGSQVSAFREEEPYIYWDPSDYHFVTEGKETTVNEYYHDRYGIRLRYPNLPVIRCKDANERNDKDLGYFPFELLYQMFCPVKGAKTEEHINAAHSFHDEFSGSSMIDHTQETFAFVDRIQNSSGIPFQEALGMFGFEVSNRPYEVPAVLLPEPIVRFKNEDTDQQAQYGQFNMNRRIFQRPADLRSFAVLDCTQSSSRPSAKSFLADLSKAFSAHGLEQPAFDLDLQSDFVTSRTDDNGLNPQEMEVKFHEVVRKARDFFVRDCSGWYTKNKLWFKTQVADRSSGEVRECLVIPSKGGTRDIGVIYRAEDAWGTHFVRGRGDTRQLVRVMVSFKIDSGKIQYIDPFDLLWEAGQHQALRFGSDEVFWVSEPELCYLSHDGKEISHEEVTVANVVDENAIECPSLVFVYLPENTTHSYGMAKHLSDLAHGIPSQCVVQATYRRQKNPAQYCSNIALKINTKLSSNENHAFAWDVDYGKDFEDSWVKEVPTLVLGYSLAKEQGQGGRIVIAASACLENGMQITHDCRVVKSDRIAAIDRDVMKSITIALATQYYIQTGEKPLRVLVYRDGSDGNFDEMKEEFIGIRMAFKYLFSQQDEPKSCDVPCEGGCIFCTLPITFVLCVNQHSNTIAPTAGRGNVNSGTCVDDPRLMAFRDRLGSDRSALQREVQEKLAKTANREGIVHEPDIARQDFLLISQAGLKGTSKAVLYRVFVNENAVYKCDEKASPLTKEKLQRCTYMMSYQYGTANKAIRGVPVTRYSNRVMNRVLGALSYMNLKGQSGDVSRPPMLVPRQPPGGKHANDNDQEEHHPDEIHYDSYDDYAFMPDASCLKPDSDRLCPPFRLNFAA